MTEYTKLLHLLETVPKDDTAGNDEINLRAYNYLYHQDKRNALPSLARYTHDLTAIKAVQDKYLQGWTTDLNTQFGGVECLMARNVYDEPLLISPELPTMERAWLHAVTQALEWKRQNEGES